MAYRALAAVALATLAVTATGCATSGHQVAQAQSSPTFVPHGAVPSAPIPTPAITLTDTSGSAYDLRARTSGKVALVYFGYTHCADVCPTTMADIATALRKLDSAARDQVAVVFITTDPKRDTRPVVRRWLDKFDAHFVGLTGTDAQIAAAERAFGLPPAETSAPTPASTAHALASTPVRLVAWSRPATAAPEHGGSPTPGSYDVDHFAGVIAFDRAGSLVALYPEGFVVADLVTDLKALTSRAG